MLYQPYKIYAGHYLGLNWKGILSQALLGPYHFWFLYMMICLYAVTPFLRKISQDRKLMEYFIALFLIFEFLTLYGPMLPFIGGTIESIITLSQFHFALGFTGYYILGYYLYRYPLRGRKETILYIMGASMFVFTGLATVWNVRQGAEGAEWFSKYLMPNVAIEASALYIIFTNHISRMTFSQKITLWISRLAEYSFGIYLIHALVLEFLEIIPWDTLPCNPILIVGARVLLVFTISTALTALIRKIPHIGKKIT